MIDQLEAEVEILSRHLRILHAVMNNEPIGIVRLSNELEQPHHKVRYSLRRLEENGVIKPTAEGAVTTKEAEEFVERIDAKIEFISDELNEIDFDAAAILAPNTQRNHP